VLAVLEMTRWMSSVMVMSSSLLDAASASARTSASRAWRILQSRYGWSREQAEQKIERRMGRAA
jgi:hypothetical protein